MRHTQAPTLASVHAYLYAYDVKRMHASNSWNALHTGSTWVPARAVLTFSRCCSSNKYENEYNAPYRPVDAWKMSVYTSGKWRFCVDAEMQEMHGGPILHINLSVYWADDEWIGGLFDVVRKKNCMCIFRLSVS